MKTDTQLGASFRDPSGFLFKRDGVLYRQVNKVYQENFNQLVLSGLYEYLVKKGWLIPHYEVQVPPANVGISYKVIQPEQVGFISYPYEWSFSQLKDAALLTLKIQKKALEFEMSLKDASAYNIQFRHGRPVLIDTLSFECYTEDRPWVAYRQFCQHFLAPLALMALCDIRLGQLFRIHIDGIPLDLASRLLPLKTHLNFGLEAHIHAHAFAQRRYSDQSRNPHLTKQKLSKTALLGLVDNLESTIRRLVWKPAGEWSQYYTDTNYTPASQEYKKEIVRDYLEKISPPWVWDLGANTGLFSRLASDRGIPTIAYDIDHGAVELNYRQIREQGETNLLPLVLDLTNPSPSLGWAGDERQSLLQRGPAGCVLALALIHHLAISNNVPLERIAQFMAACAPWLIIEFVPKEDSQVQRLLATREDIFPKYTTSGFEEAFQTCYRIHQCTALPDSHRSVYLMESLIPSSR